MSRAADVSTTDIWVRNPHDTSSIIRLTDAAGDDTSAQWSINGKIAFVSNRDGNREIYSMFANGSNVMNLTNDPAADTEPLLESLS